MTRARRKRGPEWRPHHPEAPPEPAPAHPPRAWATAALALVLAWALVFLPQLVLGRRIAEGDALLFRPFSEFSRARWHESHERTYWNPYVFLGIETVASFADSRPQYLPDRLLDLADRLREPKPSPQLWMLLVVLVSTLAAAALPWALWRVDPWSATAGGLVWLLAAPALFPWTLGFDAQVVSNALLPVALLGTWAVVSCDGLGARVAGALGLALALGLQALHGHPQVLVYSADLVAAFALQQAWTRRRWRRLLPWAAAVALGVAIGAAVWWPALLYSGLSSRGAGAASGVADEVVARYSLSWRDLITFVWPHALGFGGAAYWGGLHVMRYTPYLGILAALFALLGLRRDRRKPASTLFWWVALLVSVACALGTRLGPVYAFLRDDMPFWSRFRSPSYVLVVATLALAMLVARGFAGATGARPAGSGGPPRAALLVCGALGLLGLALAFPLAGLYAAVAHALKPAADPAALHVAARGAGLDLLLRVALVCAALALLPAARAARRWGRPALLALLAFDLGSVGLPALRAATGPAASVEPPAPPALAQVADRTGPHVYAGASGRVVDPRFAGRDYDEAYTDHWVSWRMRCLTGNLGAFPAAWSPAIEYGLTRYRTVLRAWGVGWIDLDRGTPAPGLTRVAGDGHADVYALPRALGRAYTVPLVVSVTDADAVARAMAYPGFDPAAAAVTTDPGVAGPYPGSPGCSIRWVVDEPQRLVLETSAPDRAFLVVADSHSPGWSAWVDGAAVQIAPTDLLLRGIPVPAGHHRVEMRYETPGMREAVPVTRAGLGVWALLALAGVGWAAARPLARGRAKPGGAAIP